MQPTIDELIKNAIKDATAQGYMRVYCDQTGELYEEVKQEMKARYNEIRNESPGLSIYDYIIQKIKLKMEFNVLPRESIKGC
jgi:CRISPR/Cas system endoribonuclease Cas6 (RAMP superfamily)